MIIGLLRAVRDSSEINISHGSINDENVYIGHNGKYKLGDFGVLRMKKIVLQEKYFKALNKKAQLERSKHIPAGDKDMKRSSAISYRDMAESIRHTYTLTYEFHKYEAYKLKPRHSIFWSTEL